MPEAVRVPGAESSPSDADRALFQRTLRAGGRAVPLLAGPGALERLPAALRASGFQGRLFVVADEHAARLHQGTLDTAFGAAPLLRISGDERAKTLDAVSAVWDWLLEHGAQRRDALVAFGGGVVCDLVGFAAACYLRGIGVANVPTTLLAQVDASVGGKTGVNHARGKNLIGAFHQPLAVIADTRLLATLDRRQFANGMAEVAKIAMAMDAALFADLERGAATLDAASPELPSLIGRAIELKAAVVERDEREDGERMLLNYGHTIGHALEAAGGYGRLLHGEAVAVGMHAVGLIARRMGLLDETAEARQAAVLDALGLPRAASGLERSAVLPSLQRDKKRTGTTQRWIVAEGVGRAAIRDDVPEAIVVEAVDFALGLG